MKTAECFWCEQEFTCSEDDIYTWQDLGFDEDGNDIWIIKESAICPYCGEHTVVYEY